MYSSGHQGTHTLVGRSRAPPGHTLKKVAAEAMMKGTDDGADGCEREEERECDGKFQDGSMGLSSWQDGQEDLFGCSGSKWFPFCDGIRCDAYEVWIE